MSLNSDQRSRLIEALLSKLHDYYVFPDVAEKMDEAIRKRLAKGEYNSVTDEKTFAGMITAHLREVGRDRHLVLSYTAEATLPAEEGQTGPERSVQRREQGAFQNFGFTKVERLPGNIGYLDIRAFYAPEFAGDVAVAAMNFLANTSALIIDLRKNNGGDPSMIALITSYLFPAQPVHLNSLYWRASDSTQQFWTLPYVPGKRYGDKPVYVLTSHETFSGAEEFTYNLKTLKRATIIGEVTSGGAHPAEAYSIDAHFRAFIPAGHAINPITSKNWEGTGVAPDIEVLQEEALRTAHRMALKNVLNSIESSHTKLASEIREALAQLEQ